MYVKLVGQGPPLVLLHGWGWHSGIWQPVVLPLSQHFTLYLVDLPGCGKSPLLSTYDLKTITKAIFAEVPSRATWLGWSLGGMIAWWVAIHYPEKVERLITVASSPKFIADDAWLGVDEAVLERFKQLLLHDPEQTLKDFLQLQLRGNPKNAEMLMILEKELFLYPTSKEALVGGLDLLRTMDLRSELSKLQVPSLHLFGSHDTLVPQKVVDFLPKEHCKIIQRSGHMPFLSHPEMFHSFVSEYRFNALD